MKKLLFLIGICIVVMSACRSTSNDKKEDITHTPTETTSELAVDSSAAIVDSSLTATNTEEEEMATTDDTTTNEKADVGDSKKTASTTEKKPEKVTKAAAAAPAAPKASTPKPKSPEKSRLTADNSAPKSRNTSATSAPKSRNNSSNVSTKPASSSASNTPPKPKATPPAPKKEAPPKPAPAPPKPKAPSLDGFFKQTDSFLKKHVRNGLVAYSAIKSNPAELNALIKQVETANLSSANSVTKQAFYINAYNLLVVKSIIDNNIPASPLDVSGFFKSKPHKVAGKSTTLDKLEKTTLFGLKKDARFHFAVVCAAVGCPRLENFAYMPNKLNSQLDKQTKRAVNDATFTQVNKKKKTVYLSKIFEWYSGDFGDLLTFVNKYRSEKIPEKYKVDFYEYNWKTNKQ